MLARLWEQGTVDERSLWRWREPKTHVLKNQCRKTQPASNTQPRYWISHRQGHNTEHSNLQAPAAYQNYEAALTLCEEWQRS